LAKCFLGKADVVVCCAEACDHAVPHVQHPQYLSDCCGHDGVQFLLPSSCQNKRQDGNVCCLRAFFFYFFAFFTSGLAQFCFVFWLQFFRLYSVLIFLSFFLSYLLCRTVLFEFRSGLLWPSLQLIIKV
jgi:hypothetical protein